MGPLQALLILLNGYKTYAALILTVVTAIATVLNDSGGKIGLPEILKILAIVAGGSAAASMRHSVAKVSAVVSR